MANHNDVAEQAWDVATSIVRAQAAAVQATTPAPKAVYLLWRSGHLLGVCGTYARAEQERAHYLSLDSTQAITIDVRVVHQ